MFRRKIQLVAGTTFSISLPKEWVLKQGLRARDELVLSERADGSLMVGSRETHEGALDSFELCIDGLLEDIDQVLFAIYYLGVEHIDLFSKEKIGKEVKTRIRKALTYMSGTEITFEDKKRMRIKVFLDTSRVDVSQIFYRLGLIIDASLASLQGDFDLDEIELNEAEVDRLYHLIVKIISRSLRDTPLLNSSGIGNAALIPSYFLIAKKLENISDNVTYLARHLRALSKSGFKHDLPVLSFLREELGKSVGNLTGKKKFLRLDRSELAKVDGLIQGVRDQKCARFLSALVRYLVDVHDELASVAFYRRLIREGTL